MSPLQFALFFAALLIGYARVHVRLLRFEEYLREIAALRLMNERLEGVAQALQRAPPSTGEERWAEVCGELRALRAAVDRLERVAAEMRAPPAAAPAPPESVAERLRAAVTNRLAALGYTNLRILTDLSRASPGGELEVAVECDKGHVAHKGRVFTAAGAIRDVRLQSVTQSFP